MERIQQGQGRALEKMTNDNEYPKQIRDLQEQLKGAREKCRELEERAKREERASLLAQERMVGLEEKNRKLQDIMAKVKSNNGNMQMTGNDELDQYDLAPENMNLQYKLQEAQRVNSILVKSRDVLSKTITQMKQKMDKVVDKYKQQLEFLSVSL